MSRKITKEVNKNLKINLEFFEFTNVVSSNIDTLITNYSFKEFIDDFEFVFYNSKHLPISNNENKDVFDDFFFQYAVIKCFKSIDVIDEYYEHCENTNKKCFFDNDENFVSDIYLKNYYLIDKAKQRNFYDENFNNFINDRNLKPKKERKTAKPIIKGVRINVSERYSIANNLLNFESIVRNLDNTSASQKHKLISIILGCDEQVARNLYNGTHQKRTPVRNEIIDEYLKELK